MTALDDREAVFEWLISTMRSEPIKVSGYALAAHRGDAAEDEPSTGGEHQFTHLPRKAIVGVPSAVHWQRMLNQFRMRIGLVRWAREPGSKWGL